MISKEKIWTNGAYNIQGRCVGIWRWKRIKGTIVSSKYPNVHAIGCKVSFPLYHLFWDINPQFHPLMGDFVASVDIAKEESRSVVGTFMLEKDLDIDKIAFIIYMVENYDISGVNFINYLDDEWKRWDDFKNYKNENHFEDCIGNCNICMRCMVDNIYKCSEKLKKKFEGYEKDNK